MIYIVYLTVTQLEQLLKKKKSYYKIRNQIHSNLDNPDPNSPHFHSISFVNRQ